MSVSMFCPNIEIYDIPQKLFYMASLFSMFRCTVWVSEYFSETKYIVKYKKDGKANYIYMFTKIVDELVFIFFYQN